MDIQVREMADFGRSMSGKDDMCDAEATEFFRYMWETYVGQDEAFLTEDERLIRRNILEMVGKKQKILKPTIKKEPEDFSDSSSSSAENPKKKTGIFRVVAGIVKKIDDLSGWKANRA